jgi:hypothetical protein
MKVTRPLCGLDRLGPETLKLARSPARSMVPRRTDSVEYKFTKMLDQADEFSLLEAKAQTDIRSADGLEKRTDILEELASGICVKGAAILLSTRYPPNEYGLLLDLLAKYAEKEAIRVSLEALGKKPTKNWNRTRRLRCEAWKRDWMTRCWSNEYNRKSDSQSGDAAENVKAQKSTERKAIVAKYLQSHPGSCKKQIYGEAGISQTNFYKWLRGENVSLDVRTKLARFFGIPADSI